MRNPELSDFFTVFFLNELNFENSRVISVQTKERQFERRAKKQNRKQIMCEKGFPSTLAKELKEDKFFLRIIYQSTAEQGVEPLL